MQFPLKKKKQHILLNLSAEKLYCFFSSILFISRICCGFIQCTFFMNIWHHRSKYFMTITRSLTQLHTKDRNQWSRRSIFVYFEHISPQVRLINFKMYNFFFTLSRSASSERKFPPPSRDSSSSRVLSSSYSWTNISAVGSKSWSSDDKEPTEGAKKNGWRRVSGTQRKISIQCRFSHTKTKN